jgi:hypothetical protein
MRCPWADIDNLVAAPDPEGPFDHIADLVFLDAQLIMAAGWLMKRL